MTTFSKLVIACATCATFLGCVADTTDPLADEDAEPSVAASTQALCTGPGPCHDVIQIGVREDPDGRTETGHFSGGGACFAYEHMDFDGDRQELGLNRMYTYVGDHFNDEISSFRIAPNCYIEAWEHRDQGGASTVFLSDTYYVGEIWNDRISSYSCQCR